MFVSVLVRDKIWRRVDTIVEGWWRSVYMLGAWWVKSYI